LQCHENTGTIFAEPFLRETSEAAIHAAREQRDRAFAQKFMT
jgi:hypothetical protein